MVINVLHIEDNLGDVRLIHELLLENPINVYDITSVNSIEKVRAFYQKEKVDIILLDLSLPDSSGIETLEKTQSIFPDTPIIVLTGSADDELPLKLIKRGAQDYLFKNSITAELLIHSIRYAIDRNIFLDKLTETQQQFIDLIEKNSDGIIVVSKEGIIKYISPAGEKLFIQSKEKLLGQSFGYPISFKEFTEIEIVTKSGILKIVEMRVSEIVWEGEKCYLAALRDISARKEMERKNIEYSEKLKQANQDKDKLFSIIAHDLRSPFQGLINLTQLMEDGGDDFTKEQLLHNINILNKSAQNIFQLLANLLDWSLIQKDGLTINPTKINLNTIFEQNRALLLEKAIQKNIKINNKVSNKHFAFADHEMIDSLIRNLITNAIKFSNNGGSITLKSKIADDEHIRLSIQDNGIGMDENILSKLFEVGANIGRKGTDGEPSSGLGLLLCKEFVEKNDGKIWAESELEKGTIFYFTLPVYEK